MSCADIPDWYLRHRIPVINTRSGTWREVSVQLLPPGYETTTCLRRLADAKRVRQLARGLWQVLDPAREPPAIALADAVFRDVEHYITTDAALAAEGLIDQPVPLITVVVRKKARPLMVGPTTVRAVWMGERGLAAAEVVHTTRDGYRTALASPTQAIVDALVEPRWMTHRSLLPEVLQQLPSTDIQAAAERSLARSRAAAARLGYWLEGTGLAIPQALESFVPNATTELVPGRRGPYSTRWRVYG
jgi:hypothetical protein